MRIAIPLVKGKLCNHFGHCEKFAIVDIDNGAGQVCKIRLVEAPEHQPGLLPVWISDLDVNLVIAGGMGQRAQQLLNEHGVKVITGAPVHAPQRLVTDYMLGTLQTGVNACDH